MITIGEARAIVARLNPSRLVRIAYRAAADASPPSGRDAFRGGITAHPYVVAGMILDLETGTVRVLRWQEDGQGDPMRMPPNLVALAWADTALVEEISRRYGEGCALPPSAEVLEECMARDAAADDIGVSWSLVRVAVEDRLRERVRVREKQRRRPGNRLRGETMTTIERTTAWMGRAAEATRERWARRIERAERILSEGRIYATAGSGVFAVEKPAEEQPKLRKRERPHVDTVSLADDTCGCDEHGEFDNCAHKVAVKRYVRAALFGCDGERQVG